MWASGVIRVVVVLLTVLMWASGVIRFVVVMLTAAYVS
jgi:hypothetical protein